VPLVGALWLVGVVRARHGRGSLPTRREIYWLSTGPVYLLERVSHVVDVLVVTCPTEVIVVADGASVSNSCHGIDSQPSQMHECRSRFGCGVGVRCAAMCPCTSQKMRPPKSSICYPACVDIPNTCTRQGFPCNDGNFWHQDTFGSWAPCKAS